MARVLVAHSISAQEGHQTYPFHLLDISMETILLKNPPPDQKKWSFNIPQDRLQLQSPTGTSGKIFGKRIAFTATEITLEIGELPNNGILQDDDPSKFIAVSFGGLRFPDSFLRVTGEYIQRLMEAGLYLNGVQYRFYHHSNSQLVRHLCMPSRLESLTTC